MKTKEKKVKLTPKGIKKLMKYLNTSKNMGNIK
jgi:hypothetical protein